MADTPTAPALLEPLLSSIPPSLRIYPNWVLWRLVKRPLPAAKEEGLSQGKWTKVPFQTDGKPARSNDPTTWASFSEVCAAYKRGGWSGIGIMLEGSDLVGLDLDDKDGRGTLLTPSGLPTPSLAALLAELDTYAEVSPGGKGVRILAHGTVPGSGRRGAIELYATGSPRFLTITGRRLPGAPETVNERTQALGRLYQQLFTDRPSPDAPLPPSHPGRIPGGQRATAGLSRGVRTLGDKQAALLRGDLSLYQGDHSAADLALAGLLLRQTGGDVSEADRLFRESGLMRAKWDQRHSADGRTYGQMTLDRARSGLGKVSLATPQGSLAPSRPALVLNGRQQWEIARDAWAHLSAVNRAEPTLFYREAGGAVSLCRLIRSGEGHATVQPLPADSLGHVLRRACDLTCWKKTESGLEQVPAPLPRWLPLDMVSGPEAREFLPRLRGVVGCPVITPSGALLHQPGYDPASALYLDAPDSAPPGNAEPADAKAALARLFAPFEEFPYPSTGDRANAIALLLTPFLRHYIKGPVPLCFVEAPTPGTGKSLLARCLLLVSTPGVVVSGGPSERERGAAEEWSKQLPALLTSAPAALLLDNLRGVIASATLEMLLTSSGVVQVRKLGKSDEVQSIDISGLTIAATGNNASLPRDMARRCYFVRIDAGIESPETRTGFQIADLAAHIQRHRPALLSDVLTILTAWVQAGRPEGIAHKGSFDHWAAVLSGVLDLCGVTGFLISDTERAEEADTETLQWRGFFHAWYKQAGDSPRTAKELVDLAIEHEIVMDTPGASRSLGKRLQSYRGRVFGENRIVAQMGRGGISTFALRPVENGGFDGFGGFSACHIRNENEECNRSGDTNTPITPTIPTRISTQGQVIRQTPPPVPVKRESDIRGLKP